MMKRKLLCIFLTLALCVSLTFAVSAEADIISDLNSMLLTSGEALLADDAQLMSEREEKVLLQELNTLSRKHRVQFAVVTVEQLKDTDIDTYIQDYYDTMEVGYGENRDGILLMICMDPREFRILSNGAVNDAIGNSEIDVIGEAIIPELAGGNYSTACWTFAGKCDDYLEGAINETSFSFLKWLLISLGIGFFSGFSIASLLRSQLKSVRRQSCANAYVKQGSMQITASNDMFLYRTVNRRKRESSSSGRSGGSGSSRSVGGGRF